jgi:hypothetical protein
MPGPSAGGPRARSSQTLFGRPSELTCQSSDGGRDPVTFGGGRPRGRRTARRADAEGSPTQRHAASPRTLADNRHHTYSVIPPKHREGNPGGYTYGVLLPERRRQLQPALSLRARHAPSDRDDQRSARLMCRLSPVRLWPGLGRRLPRPAREFRQPNLGLPREAVARAQRATQ